MAAERGQRLGMREIVPINLCIDQKRNAVIEEWDGGGQAS